MKKTLKILSVMLMLVAGCVVFLSLSGKEKYNIRKGEILNGTITVSETKAEEGKLIKLTNTPNSGYEFVCYKIGLESGESIKLNENLFVMPAEDVVISATFAKIHSIQTEISENGSFEISNNKAIEGEEITISAVANNGYKVSKYIVHNQDGESIEAINGKFVMPNEEVYVSVLFELVNYSISVVESSDGEIVLSSETATMDSVVEITVTPIASKQVKEIIVKTETGEILQLTENSFKMPAENVLVSASYKYKDDYYTQGLIFKDNSNYYSISGYSGIEKEVVVPKVYNNKPVSSIETFAFYNSSVVEKVVVSSSINSIGDWAFDGCLLLKGIEVDKENLQFASVDGVLFDKNITTLIKYPEAKSTLNYMIPASVSIISASAFHNCQYIESVEIPELTATIETSIFHGSFIFTKCPNLKEIKVAENNLMFSSLDGVLFNKEKTTIIKYPEGAESSVYQIPSSVTTIGSEAFSGYGSLAYVEISESVETVCDRAFYLFGSLKLITIPSSVNSFGISVFYNCSLLESIKILSSTISLGYQSFVGCTSLKTVLIEGNNISSAINSFSDCGSLLQNCKTLYIKSSLNISEFITSNYTQTETDKIGYIKFVR